MTNLAFILHIGGGVLALIAGTIAVFARKGGRLHRRAGTLFFVSMLVMAALAVYLAVVRPGQLVNLFIAAFTTYLVTTAWFAARDRDGESGLGGKIALLVAIFLCAPFAALSFQLAFGLP